MEIRKEMEALAAETLDSQFQERPELAWLKKQYGQFMRQEGISSKSAADIRLYERIYNCTPQKEADLSRSGTGGQAGIFPQIIPSAECLGRDWAWEKKSCGI